MTEFGVPAHRIVVSHDSVWCWKGQPFPEAMVPHLPKVFDPTHFDRVILPQLREAGLTEGQLAELTVDNPRRFFEGAPLPRRPSTGVLTGVGLKSAPRQGTIRVALHE